MMQDLIDEIRKMKEFVDGNSKELHILSLYTEPYEEEEGKVLAEIEDEINTGFFDDVKLIGRGLKNDSKEFHSKVVQYAAGLIVKFLEGKLGKARSLPIYRSRKLRDGDEITDIDMDATVEQRVEEPIGPINPRVFQRVKTDNKVALLVDTSFSMNGEKLLMAGLAAAILGRILPPYDLAIIGFNEEPYYVKRFEEELSGYPLILRVLQMRPYGHTDLARAIKFGNSVIADGVPHSRLLLLSDADPTRGKNPIVEAARVHKLDVLLFPMGNKWLGHRLSQEAKTGTTIDLYQVEDVLDALTKLFS